MKNVNPSNKSRIRENVVSNWTNKSVTVVTQFGCTHCAELISALKDNKLSVHLIDITDPKGRALAIESKSRTTPVVVLMTSDVVDKYLSLDNVSMKCIVTEIANHLK